MGMKHFTTEQWIDFVNQVASSSRREAMQKHLESGCRRCQETVSLWQKVRKTAATERRYQPPSEAIREASVVFAGRGFARKGGKAGSLVDVLFDSFLQPSFAGARSAGTGIRQMLYRADPYQVDVQIESKPEGNRLTVTGQLLNASQKNMVGSEIRITLSNCRGSVVHAMTNQNGEFTGEIENSGDLQLSFPRRDEKPIVISLRNALERLPGAKT